MENDSWPALIAHWQPLIDSILDEVWIFDETGRLRLVNNAVLATLGLESREQLPPNLPEILTWFQISTVDGEPIEPDDSVLRRAGQSKTVEGFEAIRVHPQTGERQYRRTNAVPLHLESGEVAGVVVVAQDVTIHKQDEESQRERRVVLEQRVKERTAALAQANAALLEQIGERERAEAAARRHNRELALLNQFLNTMSSSLDPTIALEQLADLLQKELRIPGGAILFYHPPDQQFDLRISWGLPETIRDLFASLSVVEAPLLAQESASWPDFRELTLLRESGLGEVRPNWRCFLCIPLVASGKTSGAMFLFTSADSAFALDQVAFFESLGQQIGMILQNARLFDQLRSNREQLRQLTQHVVSAQEEERRRVARELHDEAGQGLMALKYSLEIMRTDLLAETKSESKQKMIAEQHALRQRLENAIALAEKMMAEIRRLAHHLRPTALDDLGLDAALKSLCTEFEERTECTIIYEGEEVLDLPDAIEISLYRFVQEALTNVDKHASTNEVTVVLRRDATTISVTVDDNGRGFDTRDVLSEGRRQGIGLLGMQERLESVGGRLEVESMPGDGTRLVAWIPWEAS